MVVAIQTQEGIEVNWAKVVQNEINKDIQIWKTQYPLVICWFSAFYISCMCDPIHRKAGVASPRRLAGGVPGSLSSPLAEEIELHQTNMKRKDIQKQSMDKQT